MRLAEDKDGWRKIIKTSVVPLQPPQRLRAADDDDDDRQTGRQTKLPVLSAILTVMRP